MVWGVGCVFRSRVVLGRSGVVGSVLAFGCMCVGGGLCWGGDGTGCFGGVW